MSTTFTIWDAIRVHRDGDDLTQTQSADLWARLYHRQQPQLNPPWEVLERFNEILHRRTGLPRHDEWFLCEHFCTPFPEQQARYTHDGVHGPYSDECVEDDRSRALAGLALAEGTRLEGGSDLLCRKAGCRQTADGGWITEALYENEYSYCDACGDLFHHDVIYYRESRDACYCESCDPGEDEYDEDDEDEDDGRALYSYSTKIERVKYVYLRSGVRYFGLEVEMEFPGKDRSETCEWALDNIGDLSSLAIFKEDGSLTHGAELVTVPQTLDYWRGDNPLKDLCHDTHWRRIAKSHNTTTCGLHIHVSRNTVPEPTIAKLIVLMNDDSMRDLVTLIARRAPTSTYCLAQKKKWLSDVNYDWQRALGNYQQFETADAGKPTITHYIRPTKAICKKQYGQHGRYTPVNLTDNTLEFRIFRGTLKWETILASIEFCDAVISYCQQYGASAMNATRFREWLNKSITRKTYPALRDYLVTRKVFAAPKPAPLVLSEVTECHVAAEYVPRYMVYERVSWSHLYVVHTGTVRVYNPVTQREHTLNPAYRDSITCNGCTTPGYGVAYVTAVCTVEDVPVGSAYVTRNPDFPSDNVWMPIQTRIQAEEPVTI